MSQFEHVHAAVAVLDVGRVDQDGRGQPEGVDDQMALAALDLLARVVAAGPPFSVVLTVWLSTMPAVGGPVRPAPSRPRSGRGSIQVFKVCISRSVYFFDKTANSGVFRNAVFQI